LNPFSIFSFTISFELLLSCFSSNFISFSSSIFSLSSSFFSSLSTSALFSSGIFSKIFISSSSYNLNSVSIGPFLSKNSKIFFFFFFLFYH
jgi:hypothetical protein